MVVRANKYQETPYDAQREIMNGSDFRDVVEKVNAEFLKPEDVWQPSDFVPPTAYFLDSPLELQSRISAARGVSDGIVACLIGNTVTEIVLGNYTREIEKTFPQNENTKDHPLHRFGRLWAAEEERHGIVLDRYIGFIDRVDMGNVEQTVMRLNVAGFDMRNGDCAFQGIVYPMLQEYLTAVAHANTGRLSGDPNLKLICNRIGADEIRHQKAYHSFVSSLMSSDPVGVTTAFGNIVRKGIIMPAEQMNSQDEPNLYRNFSEVAAQEKVLGPRELLKAHRIIVGSLGLDSKVYTGLNSDDSNKARDFLLDTYPRGLERAAEMVDSRPKREINFSWIKKAS